MLEEPHARKVTESGTTGLPAAPVTVAPAAPAGSISATAVPTVTAAPATLAPADAALPRSTPVTLDIPSIDVHSVVYDVGLNPDGSLEVPAPGPLYDSAAWYRYSPTPGELGPAVIEGHLDSPTGPSVFYRLGELTPGAEVLIRRSDGRVLTFEVTGLREYPKAEFPTAEVYGNLDHPGLRLLTCGGSWNPDDGYRDNVVVFARLVRVVEPAPVQGWSHRY